MNTFKRKALFTAVVAGLGVAGTAEAVYLSPNRTGQVLVYPYYTVNSVGGNAWNTYLSIVNTTTFVKAVKVRILEGRASAEVLDFNLFLSPNDVWTAAIFPTSGGAGAIATADTSCTIPAIPAAGEPFRSIQYDGDPTLAMMGTGLDRTREGYVEMLEMGVLSGTPAGWATHGSSGSPANCPALRAATDAAIIAATNAPTGGMMGTGTLINVNSGRDAGYKADALEAWSNVPQYTNSGSTSPTLGNANPAQSVVIRAGDLVPSGFGPTSSAITAYRSDFAALSNVSAGARAVASVFMHSAVMNEYVLDNTSASLTDWVITQPIKNLFIFPSGTADLTAGSAAQPYTGVYTTAGACEPIQFNYFNREESGATASGSDFSPRPVAPTASICWESTVLSIRNPGAPHNPSDNTVSTVLGSRNLLNVNVTSGFQNGWAQLTFAGTGALDGLQSAPAGTNRVNLGGTTTGSVVQGISQVTYVGLPVTGFMIRTFANGGLTCGSASCQGNYGAAFTHSFRTDIRP